MKIKTLILTLLIMVVITVGCIFAYNYFTSDNTDVSVNEEQKSTLFTLDNYPKVDASLATQPLTDAFAAAFTGEKNIPDDWYGYTNTHPAYLRLIDKEVDVIVVTEPSEDELKYAKDKLTK